LKSPGATRLSQNHIRISVIQTDNSKDNAVAEEVNSILKHEFGYDAPATGSRDGWSHQEEMEKLSRKISFARMQMSGKSIILHMDN
jgi:hypothetical protein